MCRLELDLRRQTRVGREGGKGDEKEAYIKSSDRSVEAAVGRECLGRHCSLLLKETLLQVPMRMQKQMGEGWADKKKKKQK